ncbi:hypothetical protein [Ructibacterium gallinarum]|uniref:Uncharacterized protein n=1 Tax=Ructibacterium gallinarum TaxID=2779355 RepID=A0A9D5LYV6_9FIRM|nr:hypothetical protein [Ructibacterium gallinarum]MBE5040548.1 hypothetical protein [Ructibacterium gallinarum]
MANYECAVRTNYFHVKDAGRFREFMKNVCGSEDKIDLWERQDADSRAVFGFGCYGGIAGLKNPDGEIDNDSFDQFIAGLQEHIGDNDAVILFEAGNEKLRYVTSGATVITGKGCVYLDVERLAIQKAQEQLENPNWATKCVY